MRIRVKSFTVNVGSVSPIRAYYRSLGIPGPLCTQQDPMSYMSSMLVAALTITYLSVGGFALSISRPANFTASLFEHDPTCETVGNEKSQSCDVAENARGELTAQKAVRPFFVKFHKVGGTTLMELLNTFMGITTNCGRSCGDCFCVGAAKACTGHASRVVLQHLVLNAERGLQYGRPSFLRNAKASVDTQLVPVEERQRLFIREGGVPLKWLPRNTYQNDALLFITLLRSPTERIRSKYYFTRDLKSPQPSKHMSFVRWMEHMKDDHETCCEYVAAFGIGSLSTSKKVLASLFDVIGFTEQMDEAYVDVAKHMGVPESHLPSSISCRGNSENKEDWTSEQLRLAETVVADDLELYKFAKELTRKRQRDAPGRDK